VVFTACRLEPGLEHLQLASELGRHVEPLVPEDLLLAEEVDIGLESVFLDCHGLAS